MTNNKVYNSSILYHRKSSTLVRALVPFDLMLFGQHFWPHNYRPLQDIKFIKKTTQTIMPLTLLKSVRALNFPQC